MRHRKARFTLKDGKLLSDGQPIGVDPCLVAVCLVADGAPASGDGPIPDETGARILRLASAVSMVHQLEKEGLVLGSTPVYADEEGKEIDRQPKADTGPVPADPKPDLMETQPVEAA
jgi:hypothetical protein